MSRWSSREGTCEEKLARFPRTSSLTLRREQPKQLAELG